MKHFIPSVIPWKKSQFMHQHILEKYGPYHVVSFGVVICAILIGYCHIDVLFVSIQKVEWLHKFAIMLN